MEVEDRLMEEIAAQGPRALGCAAAATVCGSNPNTEDSLIGQQQWKAIHERRAAGVGISAIARELDLDRKTVRSCLRQPTWTPYRRELAIPTLLDDQRRWLAERAPQVHYSARILHQELKERGWSGSYETVKLAVRPMRAAASVAALTQRRFETAPGEQAQVDWGQLTVRFGGERFKIHVLVMTLGYSRRAYAEGFLRERMPDLLAAHENAFAHFGGRCETLLYDRMRTVVLGTTSDSERRRVISRRHERGPMILTSNQSFGAWGEVFGDRIIATAILDRLLHHAVTINIRGNSYRLKEKLKAGLVRSHDDGSQPGGEI